MNEWNGPVCELVTKLGLVGVTGEMMMMMVDSLIWLLLPAKFIHGNRNNFCRL